MATPYQIKVTPAQTGLLKLDQTNEVAEYVTELLQKDLEIVHHTLTLFGSGADIPSLTKAWEGNVDYQRPARPGRDSVAESLGDWSTAQKHLGNQDRYADFLLYYQREMERLGGGDGGGGGESSWKQALLTHMFRKGDPRADDLFQRMFAGFLHPLIQLLYGVEWCQPAIVAEALAQAAVHRNQLGTFLSEADRRADEVKKAAAAAATEGKGDGKKERRLMPSLMDLVHEARAGEKLRSAARWGDDNKIYDGVLVRAPDEALDLAAKVVIEPDELEERTAEMFFLSLYIAAGAAVHDGKEPRVDFFLMHHVNAAPIHQILNAQDWLPIEEKVRLLEWKIRLDLIQYIARGCPPLKFDEATRYKPRSDKLVAQNIDLLPRFHTVPDDGHTIKLARAIQLCRDLSQKYKDSDWMTINDEEGWSRISHMALDATQETTGSRYVRSAGFEEAWKDIPSKM